MKYLRLFAFIFLTSVVAGCSSTRPPLPQADSVDIPKFMGAWYVIGYTPIIVDKEAHNAVEHYFQADNGRILTTYQFRKGGVTGPLKTYKPTGFPREEGGGAAWDMQFIWPFRADYIIQYLSKDGQRTIIAHPNRKYAWIMQRSPEMDDGMYAELLSKLTSAGFDPEKIERVPHDWRNEQKRLADIKRAGKASPLAPR